jgi:hypothetical protein
MRVALIPIQDALQKVVILKTYKDFSTEEFSAALKDAIEAAQGALVWLYSNNTGSYKRPPEEKKLKKFIIPRDDEK